MNTNILAAVLGLAVISTLGAVYFNKSSEPFDSSIILKNVETYKSLDVSELQYRISLFKQWINKNNKSYSLAEVPYRFSVWNNNYEFVQDHNSKNLSWTVEMNLFADLSIEEFRVLYLGFDGENYVHNQSNIEILDEVNVPKDVDWRTKGAVTAIKNQGQCGDCYAFASAQALEGLMWNKTKKLVSLSAQQICDCSKSYGNNGCNGGLMTSSFDYTAKYGIESSTAYPEKQAEQSCKYKSSGVVFTNEGYKNVRQSASALKAAVALGPVTVGVEADQKSFQLYKEGVLSSNCGTNLDHAITVVGYKSTSHWIVKNQWGSNWGQEGYIWIAQGKQNNGAGVCGINSAAVYPYGNKTKVEEEVF